MELKEFQLNAVKSLFEAMDKPVRDIILKSPTGSGKTIILTYFMHQYTPIKNVKYGCCAMAFLLRKSSGYLNVLILLMKQKSNLTIKSTRWMTRSLSL